jgi:hypothetical protein
MVLIEYAQRNEAQRRQPVATPRAQDSAHLWPTSLLSLLPQTFSTKRKTCVLTQRRGSASASQAPSPSTQLLSRTARNVTRILYHLHIIYRRLLNRYLLLNIRHSEFLGAKVGARKRMKLWKLCSCQVGANRVNVKVGWA